MSSEPASTFHIGERHSIWRVTLDGAFYGDYRTLDQATEGADAGAAPLRARGTKVTIVAPARP
jgi:hypothetical protein